MTPTSTGDRMPAPPGGLRGRRPSGVLSSGSGLRPWFGGSGGSGRNQPSQASGDCRLSRIGRLRHRENRLPASHPPDRATPSQDLDAQPEDRRRYRRRAAHAPRRRRRYRRQTGGHPPQPGRARPHPPSFRGLRGGHPQPPENLCLRLRSNGSAGQTSRKLVLAAVLGRGSKTIPTCGPGAPGVSIRPSKSS